EHARDPPEPDPAVRRVTAPEAREHERAERAAYQASDVAAVRDVGEREAEDQVDHDEPERLAAEHVVALALEDQSGAEDPEDRAGGADCRLPRVGQERSGRPGQAGDAVDQEEPSAPERLLDSA